MKSACFTTHPGKNPPPQNGCRLKSVFSFKRHRFHILHFPNSTGLFTKPTCRHYTKHRFSHDELAPRSPRPRTWPSPRSISSSTALLVRSLASTWVVVETEIHLYARPTSHPLQIINANEASTEPQRRAPIEVVIHARGGLGALLLLGLEVAVGDI
jgi:hypothetical protein